MSFTAGEVHDSGKPYWNGHRLVGEEIEIKENEILVSMTEAKRLHIKLEGREPNCYSRLQKGYYGQYIVSLEPMLEQDLDKGLFSSGAIQELLKTRVKKTFKKIGYCVVKEVKWKYLDTVKYEEITYPLFDVSQSEEFKKYKEERDGEK